MSDHDAPAAEWVETASLVPWAGNPRVNDAATAKIVDSIKRFGFGAPIVARRENREVIAGHTRLKAALRIGLERVPVRFLDVSEDEAHKLAIADNSLAELASWDDGALGSMLTQWTREGDPLSELAISASRFRELLEVTDSAAASAQPQLTDTLQYRVVVSVDSETDQRDLIAYLEGEGLKCVPLIV